MASNLTSSVENDNIICAICRKKTDDSILFGEKITKLNITVHYFCLLLSTNLQQLGKDTGGILGFLINDIKREIEAAKARFCIYCGENGASIECNNKACQKYFHLICGITNYCQHEFIDQFKSYCHKHTTIIVNKKHNANSNCRICYEPMNIYNAINSIKGNCCGYGWVHSKCLKKYALKSGYYLKCLWCKNPKFRDQIRKQGIFVPDRDAAWELDKNNFAGLYENYSNCDAKLCLCPYGRRHIIKKNNGLWKLLICNTCGASGIHKHCYDKKDTQFTCSNCLEVFNKTISRNCVNSYRTLIDDHLELTIPSVRDYENFNDTLFIKKLNQETNNNDLGELFQDPGPSYLQKLLKYDPKTNQVVGVVLANVDAPNKDEFKHDEIEIIKEVNANTKFTISKDLIWKHYKAVLEDEKQRELLNDGNNIVVEDSDEETEQTTSDLLLEIMNKPTELTVPKPIIKSKK